MLFSFLVRPPSVLSSSATLEIGSLLRCLLHCGWELLDSFARCESGAVTGCANATHDVPAALFR